jgi:hypothetical protein
VSEDKAAVKRLACRIHEDSIRIGSVILHLEESLELLLEPSQLTPVLLQRVMEATAVELHGFYTGTEKIIERLVEYKTGSIPSGKSSHQELLITASEIGLLSEDQHTFLRELGALRHFVRHSYGIELDLPDLTSSTKAVIAAWPDLSTTFDRQEQALIESLSREV